jgi:tripartite-type tricarboxylate transporter receptor subunit TctC
MMTMQQATAQSVEQFCKGRTITMLVGTSPGGINDISARLAARHFGRFVPGNHAIVVQNNPGAGGRSPPTGFTITSRGRHRARQGRARGASSPSRATPTPSSIR